MYMLCPLLRCLLSSFLMNSQKSVRGALGHVTSLRAVVPGFTTTSMVSVEFIVNSCHSLPALRKKRVRGWGDSEGGAPCAAVAVAVGVLVDVAVGVGVGRALRGVAVGVGVDTEPGGAIIVSVKSPVVRGRIRRRLDGVTARRKCPHYAGVQV